MSASEDLRAEWLDNRFWERLDRLEVRHQKVQSEHETARRGLERVTPREAEELRTACPGRGFSSVSRWPGRLDRPCDKKYF